MSEIDRRLVSVLAPLNLGQRFQTSLFDEIRAVS